MNIKTAFLIADLDETLCPCTTSKLLDKVGVDPKSFFPEGFPDQTPDIRAFNQKLVRELGPEITSRILREVAEDTVFFPGVGAFLDWARKFAVVGVLTCGPTDILRATAIAPKLDFIAGSEFKFQYRTQCLDGVRTDLLPDGKAALIDKITGAVSEPSVCYIGDGLTDRHAWNVVRENLSGLSIQVARREDLHRLTKRVEAEVLVPADYRSGSLLQTAVANFFRDKKHREGEKNGE
tara:strand:- start:3992 stop:4699 length:708 start_codon:yes stop_codon:yes gene_type:complete